MSVRYKKYRSTAIPLSISIELLQDRDTSIYLISNLIIMINNFYGENFLRIRSQGRNITRGLIILVVKVRAKVVINWMNALKSYGG